MNRKCSEGQINQCNYDNLSAVHGINTDVPQGCHLSTTLYLLHINDLLRMPSIFGYAEDTMVEIYV